MKKEYSKIELSAKRMVASAIICASDPHLNEGNGPAPDTAEARGNQTINGNNNSILIDWD